MKHSFDVGTRTHEWTFGNGVADLSFVVPIVDAQWVQDVPAGNTADAALVHGYKQKIADAAAIVRDTTTGKSATDADKRAAMQAVCDRLNRGEWNATATGGKSKAVSVDALVAAIASVTGKNTMAVRAFVEAKTEEQRAALVASDRFREAYVIAVAQARPVVKLTEEQQAELDAI